MRTGCASSSELVITATDQYCFNIKNAERQKNGLYIFLCLYTIFICVLKYGIFSSKKTKVI